MTYCTNCWIENITDEYEKRTNEASTTQNEAYSKLYFKLYLQKKKEKKYIIYIIKQLNIF